MKRTFFNIVTKFSFDYMSKGLSTLYKYDKKVKEQFDNIPSETNIRVSVYGTPNVLTIKKINDKVITYKKAEQPSSVDLEIIFKFSSSLPKILNGSNSITQAYNNKEFCVKGDLRYAMALVFSIERFMGYLLPKKRYKEKYNRDAVLVMPKIKMFNYLLFSRRVTKWEITTSFITL